MVVVEKTAPWQLPKALVLDSVFADHSPRATWRWTSVTNQCPRPWVCSCCRVVCPPLHPCHPLRWETTTLAKTASEAFQYQDCRVDLLSFGAELGQHFEDVHW